MKPRNKFENLVCSVQGTLKPVTKSQLDKGYKNCFQALCYAQKKKKNCMVCGHVWASTLDDSTSCKCPDCGRKLKIEKTKKTNATEKAYFGIITTHQNFQVVRLFLLDAVMKTGRPVEYTNLEVIQHWIDPTGNVAVFSRLVQAFGNYGDAWIRSSELELRGNLKNTSEFRNSITPYYIHPKMKVLPQITRNGFAGNTHDIAPVHLFRHLLQSGKAETLLKAGQIELLAQYVYRPEQIERIWPSIKICIRNEYKIPDVKIWLDYIRNLNYLNKDLRNSHFVCPVDLMQSHELLLKKVRKVQKEQERIQRLADKEKKIKQIEGQEEDYKKLRGAYFGLCISDGDITITVLKSVRDVLEEGDELKHCVFVNNYHMKPDSLLLSAQVNGQRTETIEVKLSSLTINQARGLQNQPTEHHDRIVKLVKSNIKQIAKIRQLTA